MAPAPGPRTACLVLAAGSGVRLGAGAPKGFVTVVGRTLLEHAVSGVLAAGCIDQVVVVVPPSLVGGARALVPGEVVTAAGGGTRRESVRAGLAALQGAWGPALPGDVVLVHDAARSLTPPALFAAVVTSVRSGHPVVVPVVGVHDTVRALDPGGGGSTLVDRSLLRAVQTPQGFGRTVLEQAHAAPGAETAVATDDATLAELLGYRVHAVPGAEEAFKVTRPLDLALAEALLRSGARA